MEDSKNYTGKVVKVYSEYANGSVEYTGIVYLQTANPYGNMPRLCMLMTDGTMFDPPAKYIQKITFTRLPEDLRKALAAGCKAIQNKMAFEEEYKEKRAIYGEAVENALKEIKGHSEELSARDFMREAELLFTSRYPSTHEYNHSRYFSCTAISPKEIVLSHVQDIEKYASPSKYGFIREEYDRNLFIEERAPGYDDFCERNAPDILPDLKGKGRTYVYASIGDKAFLTVSRAYAFPLKHGLTKRSLEQLRTEVLGMALSSNRNTSLDDKIKNAQAETSTAPGQTQKREVGR